MEEKVFNQIILENIPLGILLADERGIIITINSVLERILGIKAEYLKRKSIKSIPQLKELKICSGKFPLKKKIVLNDGKPRYYRVMILKIQKEFQGYLILFEDVTEEELLTEAQKQLTNLISEKIQVPVNIIKDYIDLFLSGKTRKLPPEIQKLLEAAYQGNERLIRAINNVLDMLDLESPELLIKKEKNVDIDKLIKKAVEDYDAQAAVKGLRLIYKPSSQKLPLLEINPTQITKVIKHLIDNAIKFTNKGSIVISVKLLKDKLIVSVKDTGVGISQTDQQFLFQKFLRLRKIKENQESLGLGLYICRMIIEKHGGEIWVKSKRGQGSTFSFSLPLK